MQRYTNNYNQAQAPYYKKPATYYNSDEATPQPSSQSKRGPGGHHPTRPYQHHPQAAGGPPKEAYYSKQHNGSRFEATLLENHLDSE